MACLWMATPPICIHLPNSQATTPSPLPSFLPSSLPSPARATINRYGFNSLGADAVEENLQVRYLIQQPPLTPYTHTRVASSLAALVIMLTFRSSCSRPRPNPRSREVGPGSIHHLLNPAPSPKPCSRPCSARFPTAHADRPLPLALSQVACLASTLARTS